jgi:hypothetical protein
MSASHQFYLEFRCVLKNKKDPPVLIVRRPKAVHTVAPATALPDNNPVCSTRPRCTMLTRSWRPSPMRAVLSSDAVTTPLAHRRWIVPPRVCELLHIGDKENGDKEPTALLTEARGGIVGPAILGQIFDRIRWPGCVAGIALALVAAAALAPHLKTHPQGPNHTRTNVSDGEARPMSGGSCGERMLQFLRNHSNELPQLHRGTSLNKSCPCNQRKGSPDAVSFTW